VVVDKSVKAAPVVIDEVHGDRTLARMCWRDAEDEPWCSVTAYALNPVWELRQNLSEAIQSGNFKHGFYKIDRGKPLEREAILHGPRSGFKESDMSKMAKAVSEAVAGLKKKKSATSTEERKAKAQEKKLAAEKKAAERKAAKENKRAKIAADRAARKAKKAEQKAKATGEKHIGIVAKIKDIIRDASGEGKTAKQILAELVKAFPERRPDAMQNTIRGTFAALTKDGDLVVVKPADSREKLYSLKGSAKSSAKKTTAPKAAAKTEAKKPASKKAKKAKASEVGTSVNLSGSEPTMDIDAGTEIPHEITDAFAADQKGVDTEF
jgi:hypothetical protein